MAAATTGKKAALVAVVLLLVIGVGVIWQQSQSNPQGNEERASLEQSVVPEVPDNTDAQPARAAEENRRTTVAGELTPSPARGQGADAPEGRPSARQAETRLLEGFVTVVSDDKRTLAEESGSIALQFFTYSEEQESWQPFSTPREVVVDGGRWSTEVENECQTVEVTAATLRKREAKGLDGRMLLAETGPIELHVAWYPVLMLRFYDAETRVELTDVTVAESDACTVRGDEIVFAASVQLFNADGLPIELSGHRASGRYFASAPGYGVKRFSVGLGMPDGEVAIDLHRTCDVDVVIAGAVAADASLRLYEQSAGLTLGGPLLELELEKENAHSVLDSSNPVSESGVEQHLSFPFVAPGKYSLRLERGAPHSAQILAQSDFTAQADRKSTVTLEPKEQQDGALVILSGEVRFSNFWSTPLRSLDVVRAGNRTLERFLPQGLEVNAPRDGVLAFRCRVVPGNYIINLERGLFQHLVEVGRDGGRDIVVTVPDPVEITVSVSDESHEPVVVDWLCWGPYGEKRIAGGFLRTVDKKPGEDIYRFTVPRGQLEIHAGSASGSATTHVDAHQDQQTTLTFLRHCDVFLVAKWKGQLVPVNFHAFKLIAEEIDGDGRHNGGTMRNGTQALRVSHPGRYRFNLGDVEIPGYRTIPIQELTVERGENELVIELERVGG